jgi:flagellar biosynthesis protein FliP
VKPELNPGSRLDLLAFVVGVIGFGLLVAGIGFIYWPAALIVAGLALLAWSFMAARAVATINARKTQAN